MSTILAVLASVAILYTLYEVSMNTGSSSPSPLAKAIATAEGFFASNPNIPQNANNPGDLAMGDQGLGTLGSMNITVFGSLEEGWQNLEAKLSKWFAGDGTTLYDSSMTIQEFADTYVNGPNGGRNSASIAWANNVANSLGVSTDTSVNEVYSG